MLGRSRVLAGVVVSVAVAIAALGTVAVRSDAAAAADGDQFVWPVTGSVPAGDIAWHQVNEAGAEAVDIGAGLGTSVYPAASGVILSFVNTCADSGSWGCGDGFGNHVIVRHDRAGRPAPLYSLYGHLKSSSVRTSGPVTTSDVLGVVAMSGSTTGPHTHWAIGTCPKVWGEGAGGCTIWRAPETVAVSVVHGTPVPGSYPELQDLPTGWASEFVSQAAFLVAALTQPWDLESAYPTQQGFVRFVVRNTGSVAWAADGANPVNLATASPQDRASGLFTAGSWLSPSRPATAPALTPPGGTAAFTFKVTVPAGSGVLREHFQMVAEGATWFGPDMWLDFGRPTWSASFLDQGAYLDPGLTQPWDLSRSAAGQAGWVRFSMRNTGAQTWTNSGANPVKLGTVDNTPSTLFTDDWLSSSRPTPLDQPSVAPGQVGTFTFQVRIPSGVGAIRDNYRLLSEGAAWMGPGLWLDFARMAQPETPQRPSLDPRFTSIQPARLYDSRPGHSTVDGQQVGDGPLRAGTSVAVAVASRGGVPANATAVTLNVTVTGGAGPGFLTVYPCSEGRPLASNLNFVAGQTLANAAVGKLSPYGMVCVFSPTVTDLVVDVTGFVVGETTLRAVSPARLADSRSGEPTVDGILAATGLMEGGTVLDVTVAGRAGLPSDSAGAFLNVTVTGAVGPGYLTVFPCGTARPFASNLNFNAGQTVANMVASKVGPGGRVCVYSTTATHLIVDAVAVMPAASTFVGLSPARVLDSRPGAVTVDGLGGGGGFADSGSVTEVKLPGRAGVVEGAATAVLNVTATEPDADGFITVFPCGAGLPVASNLNFTAGQTVANTVVTKIGSAGTVCLYTSSRGHLIVDVNGTFS